MYVGMYVMPVCMCLMVCYVCMYGAYVYHDVYECMLCVYVRILCMLWNACMYLCTTCTCFT